MFFVHNLSVWFVLCNSSYAHIKLSYFSPKPFFLCTFVNKCQKHAICVVFLHKLTVWCVLYMYHCTHTEWSYFNPNPLFLMLISEQCQKIRITVVTVHKLCDWCVLCISSCTHTENGCISVLNRVFQCNLVSNVRNKKFGCFLCIN